MPESFESSIWAKVALIVAGAGGSAWVGSQVQKALPQATAEIGGAAVGVICLLWGDKVHPLVKWAGVGIIAGSLMPRIAGMISGAGAGAAPTAKAPAQLVSPLQSAVSYYKTKGLSIGGLPYVM